MKHSFYNWIVISVATVFLLSGCNSGESSSSTQTRALADQPEAEAEYWYGYEAADSESFSLSIDSPQAGGGMQPVVAQERKIIQNYDLSLQTREFEPGVARISGLALEYGGYLQDSYVEGMSLYDGQGARSASFTLRIPIDKLESLLALLGDEFNIVSRQQYVDDVTDQYYDYEARLSSLRTQEERLLAMLEQAEELTYLLEVERALSEVRYEIEWLQTSLGRLESSIQYSTVRLYLYEVVEYTSLQSQPTGFLEEAQKALSHSLHIFIGFFRGLLLFAITIFPFLILLGVVLFVILRRRRHHKRKAVDNLCNVQKLPDTSDD